jgi:hypothetical protein
MDFEVVEEYGDMYRSPDGKHVHCLHTWDDGHRTLIRCKKCGALFLRQFSEFHDMSGGNDCYYTDFFPVNDREEALLYNEKYDGFALEESYNGRVIKRNNTSAGDSWHWVKQKQE